MDDSLSVPFETCPAMEGFFCDKCGAGFAHKSSLTRHKNRGKCIPRPSAIQTPNPDEPAAATTAASSSSSQLFSCPHCTRHFSRKDNLARHVDLVHNETRRTYFCGMCPQMFHTLRELTEHRQRAHVRRGQFQLVASAHGGACQVYKLDFPEEIVMLNDAVKLAVSQAKILFRKLTSEQKHLKASLVFTLRFRQPHPDESRRGGADVERDARHGIEGLDVVTVNIRSNAESITFMGDHDQVIQRMLEKVQSTFDDFTHRGSGWVLCDCVAANVETGQCMPLNGAATCCEVLHTVSMKKRKKHVLVDVTGTRDVELHAQVLRDGVRCFLYAVSTYFLMQGKPFSEDDTSLLPSADEMEVWISQHLKEEGKMPMAVHHIDKWEEANAHLDLAVNVIFEDENGEYFPCRPSKRIFAKHQVNLILFFTHMDSSQGAIHTPWNDAKTTPSFTSMSSDHWTMLEKVGVAHYALIPDLVRVIASLRREKTNAHYGTAGPFLCYNCFNVFSFKDSLENHVKSCHTETGQIYVLPDERKKVKYFRGSKEFLQGYFGVVDFETYQGRPEARCKKCGPGETCTHKTSIEAEHHAFAYTFILIERPNIVVEEITYVGEDAAKHFIDTFLKLEEKYIAKLKAVEPMDLTESDMYDFVHADECHICHEPFWDRGRDPKKESYEGNPNYSSRVRDHDHLTGEYLGAAHNNCNLQRSELIKLTIYAHNMTGYDGHIILKAIAEHPMRHSMRLSGIPANGEKFKTLTVNRTDFHDSLAFLGDSLDRLTQNLIASNHDFPLMKKWIPDEAKRNLLLRKGVYCYDHVTHFDMLYQETSLPRKELFYSKLTQSHISDQDYEHAQKVWDAFECQSLMDYTKLYVAADVYQLAENVLEFRTAIWDKFSLDMTRFVSLPQLTKDAMLKVTGVELEYMQDLEMIQLLRENIRGGLSYAATRYLNVEEENKVRKSPISLGYFDSNNLYGAAMRFAMPTGGFRWLSRTEIQALDLEKDISNESSTGYIFEVTLHYPKELHREHSSFPLAPHQQEITYDMLSPFMQDALLSTTGKTTYKGKKLTSTFLPRENYLCCGLNLKLYLDLGMKLVTVHNVIAFKQSPFLKPYIDMCTKQRAQAKTKTRSALAKLLSNSLYGKVSATNALICE